MKLSISIPDDLWLAVHRKDEPNSQVIQEALRLLADKRAAAAENPLPGAVGTMYDPSNTDHWADIQAGLDRLHAEAAHLHRVGYQVGVDIACRVPWHRLEWLPEDRAALARRLAEMHVESGFEADQEVFYQLDRLIGDWDVQQTIENDLGEEVDSPTFFAGVAQAIDEARDAVRARLHNDPAVGEPAEEKKR